MENSNVSFLKDENKSKTLIYKNALKNYPILISSGILTLLIIFVDAIVVARYLGDNALNGVNVIGPFVSIIGAAVGMCSRGVSIVYTRTLASDDTNRDKDVIKASVILTVVLMVLIALVEYPLAKLMIGKYALDEVTRTMAWQYTQQMMIALVIGVISTIGSAYLNALGKAKLMFGLAVMEGVVNLILDILLVGYTDLGVAGAGYATLCANILRATVTAVVLQKALKIFPLVKGIDFKLIVEILQNGIYLFVTNVCFALQGYIINWLILRYVGESGYTAYSISSFAISLGNMFISGITQAIQPVLGIFTQIRFYNVSQRISRDTLKIVVICAMAIAVIFFTSPQLLFGLYKITDYTQMQVNIVRIFVVYMVFYCINYYIRVIMNNWDMDKAASILSMTEYIFLLVPMCVVLQAIFGEYGLFSAYICSSFIIFCVTIVCFRVKFNKLKKNDVGLADWELTLTPSQASQAQTEASQFLEEYDIPGSVKYKIALLIEEFTAYVKGGKDSEEITINLYIRIFSDRVNFFTVNNGEDEGWINELIQDSDGLPMANNYYLINKVSDAYAFRRICDLNTYSICIRF